MPSDWPTDAVVIRCPSGHPVTYWSRFIESPSCTCGGRPGRHAADCARKQAPSEVWHVRLSPHWVRDAGGAWRRGNRVRRKPWQMVRMPDGLQQDELPDESIRAKDGIHLPPPVALTCPTCPDSLPFTVDAP